MDLKNLLKRLSMDDINSIAITRDIELEDPLIERNKKIDRLIDIVYENLIDDNNITKTFQKLKQNEIYVLQFFLLNGFEATLNEVCERCFKGEKHSCLISLDNLKKFGFLFVDKKILYKTKQILYILPNEYSTHIYIPPAVHKYLGGSLNELNNNEFKNISQRLLNFSSEFQESSDSTYQSIDSNDKNRTFMIHHTKNKLLNPAFFNKYIENLSENESTIFNYILRNNGKRTYKELKLLEITNLDELLYRLRNYYVLIFYHPYEIQNCGVFDKDNQTFYIPTDLYNVLITDNKDVEMLSKNNVLDSSIIQDQNIEKIIDNSDNLLRDIAIFLSYIYKYNLRVVSTSGLHINDYKKISNVLNKIKDFKYISLLLQLSKHLDLIQEQDGIWSLTYKTNNYFNDIKTCYKEIFNYLKTPQGWNEGYVTPDLLYNQTPFIRKSTIILKDLILSELFKLPENVWIDLDFFIFSIISRNPSFETIHYNNFSYPFNKLLLNFINEFLCWYGIVAIGIISPNNHNKNGFNNNIQSSSKNNPNSGYLAMNVETQNFVSPHTVLKKGRTDLIKLTKLGQYIIQSFFDKQPSQKASELVSRDSVSNHSGLENSNGLPAIYENYCIIQSNFDVIIPPNTSVQFYFELCKICQFKDNDVLNTFAITKESLRTTLDKGVTNNEIKEFFRTYSKTGIPETVENLIDDCSSKHGEIEIGHANLYLKTESPFLLKEIKSLKKLEPFLKYELADNIILLSEKYSVDHISKELREFGFMPRIITKHIKRISDSEYEITFKKDELVQLLSLLEFFDELSKEFKIGNYSKKLMSVKDKILTFKGKELINNATTIKEQYLSKLKDSFKEIVDSSLEKQKREMGKILSRIKEQVNKESKTYKGPNPAEKKKDIINMIKYAIQEGKLLEIFYHKKLSQKDVTIALEPIQIEHSEVSGTSIASRSLIVLKLDRIIRAKLLEKDNNNSDL